MYKNDIHYVLGVGWPFFIHTCNEVSGQVLKQAKRGCSLPVMSTCLLEMCRTFVDIKLKQLDGPLLISLLII